METYHLKLYADVAITDIFIYCTHAYTLLIHPTPLCTMPTIPAHFSFIHSDQIPSGLTRQIRQQPPNTP